MNALAIARPCEKPRFQISPDHAGHAVPYLDDHRRSGAPGRGTWGAFWNAMQDMSWRAPEHDAIRDHTSARANRRIDQLTRGAIDEALDSPAKIRARLVALDREWDIDRALLLTFAALGTLTSSLAMRNLRRRRELGGWGALLFTQMGFLVYHAIRRWCPPMPVLRRFGVRSGREISAERAALENRLAAMESP